jgi:murein DD-endopeptidase MepM/ murein hydrolase activator NlpD
MEYLRSLRRRRSLSFLDLAALTGIPARRIAELEYGLARLSPAESDTLALVLGLDPRDFTINHQGARSALAQAAPVAAPWNSQTLTAALLVVAIASSAIGAAAQLPPLNLPRWSQSSAATVASPAAPAPIGRAAARLDLAAAGDAADMIRQRTLVALLKRAAFLNEQAAPPLLGGPTPAESVAPPPLPVIEPASGFTLSAEGPRGCPVQPTVGRVVMTQGYGVGTHAPAEIWGAIDLAVDGNGDGYADHAGSWYQPIVATHEGHVSVNLDTYPGGNYVSVRDPSGVWRTGYAHLALVTVTNDQFVRAGEVIGLMGSTGMSTGPHLDYQVWRSGVNLDPTSLVGC